MFERFVASARALVIDAREQALRLGQPVVGTEHLLLALVASATPAGEVLRGAGLEPTTVEETIRRDLSPSPLEADRAALAALGIDLNQVRASVESTFGPGALAAADPYGRGGRGGRAGRRWRRRCAHPGAFSPRAKKCLELSLREALRLHHRHITSEHLALGLLADGEGPACEVLAGSGVSVEELRADLERAVRRRSA